VIITAGPLAQSIGMIMIIIIMMAGR